MNKAVCLGLSILDLRKNAMYEFWYDCIKPKHDEKAVLRYMDTDSFMTLQIMKQTVACGKKYKNDWANER